MHLSASPGANARPATLWTLQFILLCIASLFFWTSLFGSNAILPLYMTAGGFGEGAIGWVLGAGAIASLPVRLYSGRAIDRGAPAAFLVAGCFSAGLATVLVNLFPGLVGLTVLRLLQGAGIALFMNAALALVAQLAPPTMRGSAFGWWGVTNNAGNAVGAALAAWLAGRRGYPVAFWWIGVAGLAGGVLGLMLRRGGRPERPPAHSPWFTRSAVAPGLVGGALGFAGGAFMLFAPIRASELGFTNVGSYLAAYAGAMVLARLVFGPIADRHGRAWAILPGMALVAVSMVGLGLVSRPLLALGVPVLFGLGLGASMPGLLAWTVDRAGTAQRATAVSTFYMVYDLALFLGSAVVGKVREFSPSLAYMVVAGVTAAALVSYAVMARASWRGRPN